MHKIEILLLKLTIAFKSKSNKNNYFPITYKKNFLANKMCTS